MSASIQSNACFAPLFSDADVSRLFSAETLLGQMLAFEKALTKALAETGAVENTVADLALKRMETFAPDLDAIGAASLVDGLPVPEFIRQLKRHVGEDAAGALHIGATSQDLLDTALALNMRDLSDLFEARLNTLIEDLHVLNKRFGERSLMGRTRMQAALPITVADRVATWVIPLGRHLERLADLRPRVELVQFGGPVGTRTVPDGQGQAIAEMLADHFDLGVPSKAWHAMRDGVVEYGNWLALISGSLGKMGQDIALMAQQGIDDIALSGGGSSSAMPHKQNPVLAETLVAMARFNATQVSALNHALIHEQERSGAVWTLEMMVLPLMAETTCKALLHAQSLAGQITSMGE